MRVFVAGKGGAGKTTVAAALSSVLARRGVEVLAVDADGSPNLALALAAGDPERLPAVANATSPPADETCTEPPLSAAHITEEFVVESGLGVPMVQTGRIERPSERCLCCGSHATAREVLSALAEDDRRVVVADLEPGLNDLLWAKPGPGDVVVVVTDASRRSVEVARRVLDVSAELGVERTLLVANRLRPDELDRIRSAFPDRESIEIAFDPRLDGAVPAARLEDARTLADLIVGSG
jgi:CO dehydrogenase maturation factor